MTQAQDLEPAPAKAKPPHPIPAWLSMLIIAGSIAALGGVVYWYFTTGPASGDTVVLDRGPDDGIKTIIADKNWRAVSGNSVLRVTRDRKGQLQAAFDFLHYDFLPAEQFTILNNGRRIAMDSAMAADIGASEKQIAALRQSVRGGFRIEIQEADRQRLLALFKEWLGASASSREGRETALLRAMDDVGGRTAAAARKTTSDAAAKIKAALTPQQWHKFDQIGQ